MTKKLKGGSTLNVDNAPKSEEKLGLLSGATSSTKTFYLSHESIEILNDILAAFKNELHLEIAGGKVIELLLFKAENMSLDELLSRGEDN